MIQILQPKEEKDSEGWPLGVIECVGEPWSDECSRDALFPKVILGRSLKISTHVGIRG